MMEIRRLLKIGGIVEIRVPHYLMPGAYIIIHRHIMSTDYFRNLYINETTHNNKFYFKLIERRLIFPRGLNPLNWIAGLFFSKGKGINLYENTILRCLAVPKEILIKLERTR